MVTYVDRYVYLTFERTSHTCTFFSVPDALFAFSLVVEDGGISRRQFCPRDHASSTLQVSGFSARCFGLMAMITRLS